jgi:hypothetical protein
MADKFSDAELGQGISIFERTINCEVYTGKTVTKGQVVEAIAPLYRLNLSVMQDCIRGLNLFQKP